MVAGIQRASVAITSIILALLLTACSDPFASSLGVGVVSPQELASSLQQSSSSAVVIDLRDSVDYETGHIPGALSYGMDDLDGLFESKQLLQNRAAVLVCYSGVHSALGASIAHAHGIEARSMTGGMKGWRLGSLPLQAGKAVEAQIAVKKPVVILDKFSQITAIISGTAVKPLYMLLSLALIVFLQKHDNPALRKLKYGLISFLIGESICAIEFYLPHRSDLQVLDLFHGLGMVGLATLLPWALFEIIDERILRFSEQKSHCLMQKFCGHCWKRDPVACGLHTTFQFLCLALAMISLMPLSAKLHPYLYLAKVFGAPVDYGMPVLNQVIEFRVYPVIAAILYVVSFLLVRRGNAGIHAAKLPFFGATGFFMFSLFRFVIHHCYRNAFVWSDLWEELTELMLMSAVMVMLYAFRRPLGLSKTTLPAKESV